MVESFPRIVFIGTGAAANADRCHACVAVQTGPDHTLLIDTGSGVEIVRNLNRAGIPLDSVEDVFLSHRHSDHIGGLELLMLHCGLHALSSGRHANELDIYGHSLVLEVARQMINSMGSVAPKLFGQMGERLDWCPMTPGHALKVHSGVTLTPFVVDHAPPDGSCWGCTVEVERNGKTYKIVYTGDTRPTPALEASVAGANIILHECGGLDADAERVHHVGHSTAGDAGRLAALAGADQLVLYHIPSHNGVDRMVAEAGQFFTGRVTVADDLDSFDLS
ncbi:MAG TPA: MBL fold metallo-hydrolase [Chloroflexota bacterium]|nr:MBL fold metallo-hydrolase [Chloroflexota bacterium]